MQCNVLIQIGKYSKLQHSGIGKRPIFFLNINDREVGIRMSWAEKFRKINNRGEGGGVSGEGDVGTTNRDSRVVLSLPAESYIM